MDGGCQAVAIAGKGTVAPSFLMSIAMSDLEAVTHGWRLTAFGSRG